MPAHGTPTAWCPARNVHAPRSGRAGRGDLVCAARWARTVYGIAVFPDLDPGGNGKKTSITIRYYHAPGADQGATSNYDLFETVVLAKPPRRSGP